MTEIRETLHEAYTQIFAMDGALLVDEQTPFQHVQIFSNAVYGQVMLLDGIVQLTSKDEFTYSEMLVHPPILAMGRARRVMIIGGGDACVAEEVLKHGSVEQVDLVDIDARVLELCRIHFAEVNGAAYADDRLRVLPRDAFEHLQAPENRGRYDLIIGDRPDPVGPAEVLFSERFYQSVCDALTPGGMVVFQTGVPTMQQEEWLETLSLLDRAFSCRGTYLTVTPTYVGGHMALTWASRGFDFAGASTLPHLHAQMKNADIKTDYYTPEIHTAAFALPAWMERLIDETA